MRGSLAMEGYYKNPDATAEVSRFGWRHTGDIGYLDDDNYLFIVDRAKDMIITGGFNVYSIEVENALRQHPECMDGAVFGLPDDKWGERVCAVGAAPRRPRGRPAEIMAFVKAKIGSVKAPKAGRRLARPAALEGRKSAEAGNSRPDDREPDGALRRAARPANHVSAAFAETAFCGCLCRGRRRSPEVADSGSVCACCLPRFPDPGR